MTRDTVKRRLREFLGQTFPGRALDDRDDIFDLGFGNSPFATQLVEFVETEFTIEITDDDLDIENLSRSP
jgi:acyl carrier protein